MSLANNNPTDMDSYRKYQEEQRKMLVSIENKTRNMRSAQNLRDWNETLSFPWNKADMNFFIGAPRAKAAEMLTKYNIENKIISSSIVLSESGRGKTFYTHALIKEYIKRGMLTPSEIRTITIREGVENINGMFKSRAWKDDVFGKGVRLIVIEGCSRDFAAIQHTHNDRFWSEMVEFQKEEGKGIIINYTYFPDEITKDGVFPTVSNNRDLSFRLSKDLNFMEILPENQNPNMKLRR